MKRAPRKPSPTIVGHAHHPVTVRSCGATFQPPSMHEPDPIRNPNKGIEMLRLDRELAPILDRWREAVRRNPEEWR